MVPAESGYVREAGPALPAHHEEEVDPMTDPATNQPPADGAETDEIPNAETGVGVGADTEPDTFEPEEPSH